MSWFQDLAGKAENILNKIDQNAATVLQQSSSRSSNVDAPATPASKSLSSATAPPPPVLLEIQSETPLPAFKRNSSSLSVASSNRSASPRPKALSLRGASPALSDGPHKPQTPPVPSAPTTSVDDGPADIEAATDAALTHQSSPSAATSRRSSVSSTRPAGHQPDTSATPPLSVDQHNELVALKIVLNEIKAERDDARHEVRSLQNDLYALQANSKLSHLEAAHAALQRSSDELAAHNESLQQSNARYVKSISELEQRLGKSVQSEAEMRSKIEWVNKEAAQAVNELQQYRSRAQSTLQLKDRLIEQLQQAQSGQAHSDETEATGTGSGTHTLELEHAQRDKSALQDELRSLADQLALARGQSASAEAEWQRQRTETEATVARLSDQLAVGQQRWQDVEGAGRAQVRELATVREELTRVQAEFAARMHAK